MITRFAPSPTGHLHLGHAFSAFFAYRAALEAQGRFLLRIEDIDPVRCKPEYGAALEEDLRWLGLTWEEPVRRQSQHVAFYQEALEKLKAQGLIYPCFCSRSQIRVEAAASGHAPHFGEMGPVYPGTCRALSPLEQNERMATEAFVWRLDVAKALSETGSLFWEDRAKGRQAVDFSQLGDVVLARKDVPTSYHLSVTLDDALQGITLVTRGEDLFLATSVHRLLQALLGLPTPLYHHHALLCDAKGQRLAKRDNAATLRSMRETGVSPDEIRTKIEASFPALC